MMQGIAFVFRRRWGALFLGHVGWGMQLGLNGGYYCGATEAKGDVAYIPPLHDNGWWAERVADQVSLFEMMRVHRFGDGKAIYVADADPEVGQKEANETQVAGYSAIGNNCLDHVYRILRAYGVPADGVPYIRGLDDEPNHWFNDIKGEYFKL